MKSLNKSPEGVKILRIVRCSRMRSCEKCRNIEEKASGIEIETVYVAGFSGESLGVAACGYLFI